MLKHRPKNWLSYWDIPGWLICKMVLFLDSQDGKDIILVFVHWKKNGMTLLSIIAVKLRKTERCQNGLKCKFISWPICLTKYQDSSEDPQNPCTTVLCLHFNFLRALKGIQTYSLDAFFLPPRLPGTSAKQKPPCCLRLITEWQYFNITEGLFVLYLLLHFYEEQYIFSLSSPDAVTIFPKLNM